jgi:DNA-binding SARP family transcriptional activator/tetratricopeptide (TPR) repeat protein
LDFRILGPLEVQAGDRVLALGGTKQRALLAILLLHANEVVSSDRLIQALWGEEPLENAAKALQVAVSRLRRALDQAAGLLVTRPPGYELRLGRDQLDLHRFEDRVAAGREALAAGDPARAAAEVDDALALWRGPPLADLAYESFSQAEISRLEELRIAALEDRFAANLELGRHADVVSELEALVRDYPLRERLREQLMLALYRSGRQADALAAYRDARGTLVDELGIEPGRRLRDVHEQILMQDPALDLRPIDETPPTVSRGVFVGRARELAALVGALDDALAGRGRLVLLAGEPGIGKSRLADELIRDAEARGARVLIGRCWEAGGAPAYWPWVQSLRSYIQETELEPLRTQLGAGASDVAQLLPELRDFFPELPDPVAPDSAGARFRLFEAASSFLRNAAQVRPLVLTLDDLHAADEPSLLLLRLVVREMADSRLLLVGAFRNVDPTLGAPLSSALADLVREPPTTQLELAGLSEADVAEYIELSTGIEPASKLTKAIHVETEGNPFFVGGIVHLLDAEGRIAEADAHMRIPPEIRAVIGQRIGRLSEHCRNLLVPAAVIGREFGVDELTQVSELRSEELLDVLHEAMAERVVTDVPGTAGRLRFGHALIRDTLYDELTPVRRLQLHRAAGEALEALYSSDLEPHLAELAHHFIAAAPFGGADKAIDYARRAGERAAAQLAYEEAARLYLMALPLLGKDVHRCELLIALGDAQARAGDAAGSKQSLREAADLAEGLGLKEHLAKAALGYGGRFVWESSRDDADHGPLLERALAAIGEEDSKLRVRLLARFAGGPLRDPRFQRERRSSLSEQALAMARRIGDPETLAYALSGYNQAHLSPEFTPTQASLATELVDLATEAGDLERAAEGHELRAVALIELADMPGAKAALAAMAKLAEELRQPSQDWFVTVYSAHVALLEGELAEAERLIAEARRLGERGLSWNAGLSYGIQLYVLCREQGRLDEVEELVRCSARDYPTYPAYRCALAQMAAELGYTAEARGALEDLAADDFSVLPLDEDWLVSMSLLAETATILGDVEIAARLYRRLLPYRERVTIAIATVSTGAVARYLGLLAATTERWNDAERHFEEALEMNERINARSWLAHTQEDYARMLVGRGEPGDRERALELAGLALDGYRRLEMNTFAAEAARLEQTLKMASAC